MLMNYLACKHMSLIDSLKQQLRSEFEMNDFGQTKKILGVELIKKEEERNHLSYTAKIRA